MKAEKRFGRPGRKDAGPARKTRSRLPGASTLRWISQLALLVFLNFTFFGSQLVSPYLLVLRLHVPWESGYWSWMSNGEVNTAGIKLCTIGGCLRGITGIWGLGILVLVIVITSLIALIVGRAMCAWACPFGFFQDLISKVKSRLGFTSKAVPEKAHRKLVLVKYAFLLFLVLMAVGIALSAGVFEYYLPGELADVAPYCTFCPTPSFHYLLTVFNDRSFRWGEDAFYPIMLMIIGIFFAGAVVVERFWCRYLCPIGAWASLYNKASLLHLHKDPDKCTQCNKCVTACPMQIEQIQDVMDRERIMDLNCTLCTKCVEVCPEKALEIRTGDISIYKGGGDWWEEGDNGDIGN